MEKNVCILGAGLVGTLASIYLAKRGFKVDVFEKRPDFRTTNSYGGRSINLALSDRGWLALEKVGISENIKKISIPMYGRMVHLSNEPCQFQPYGQDRQAIFSVSRGLLNKELIELAEANSLIKFHFNQKCDEVDPYNNELSLVNTISGKVSTLQYDVIIGADGAFSALRNAIQKTDRFDYHQWYLPHGYKELTISAEMGANLLEANALHIWPRGQFMLIALPNLDQSFTCTLFLPFEGENSFANLRYKEEIDQFFQKYFPDAYALMPKLHEEFEHNPISSLVNISCFPWSRNRAFLIGDAAHSIVPFYGQGMNAGFEDCRILDEMLDQYNNWDQVITAFQESRKPDADAIAELARKNFLEMSELVANKRFQLRKKIESRIYKLYPDQWIPLYTMVTFSPTIRYSDALNKGIKEDQIMNDILNIPNIENIWQEMDFKEFLDS